MAIEKPGSKEDIQINGVVKALSKLGGRVETQTELLGPVQEILNCKITHAKKAISLACEKRKIVVVPSTKMNATGYKIADGK